MDMQAMSAQKEGGKQENRGFDEKGKHERSRT
jgi:hypothetical protein